MTEEIVKYETAKLAKEKGFKILVDDAYFMANDNGEITLGWSNYDEPIYGEIKAPTQSLLQRWLREVHNIEVEVNRIRYSNSREYVFDIRNNNVQLKSSLKNTYGSYEESLEYGLFEALKLME